MIVISDASPLIALAAAEVLDLLPRLFGRIVVPAAVMDEVTGRGRQLWGAAEISDAEWVEVVGSDADEPVETAGLDRGEREAIALALDLGADLLLIDETDGRAAAERLGLERTGTVGVLIRAKQAGLVQQVAPLLDLMEVRVDFRIGDAFRRDVLREVGE